MTHFSLMMSLMTLQYSSSKYTKALNCFTISHFLDNQEIVAGF